MRIYITSGSDISGAPEQLLVTANETSEQQMEMLASFVSDAYCPKALRVNAFLNIWQKVAGFHQRREPSNSIFYTSMSKLQGMRQASIAQPELLVHCGMDSTNTPVGDLLPHTSDDLPALNAVLEIVIC